MAITAGRPALKVGAKNFVARTLLKTFTILQLIYPRYNQRPAVRTRTIFIILIPSIFSRPSGHYKNPARAPRAALQRHNCAENNAFYIICIPRSNITHAAYIYLKANHLYPYAQRPQSYRLRPSKILQYIFYAKHRIQIQTLQLFINLPISAIRNKPLQ